MSREFFIKVKRALNRMWQHDIWHLQPSSPLSWRYLLPNQSAQIKLHRHLWWNSRYKLPGLLWLPLEINRWCFWRVWSCSRSIKHAMAFYAAHVEQKYGVLEAEQKKNITYWAKSWGINPFTAYEFQLFHADADALQYIYNGETSAFHAMQNRKTGANKKDHRLLGDKIKLAESLASVGIPMVSTEQVSQGDWQDVLNALAVEQRLFCKLRSGNQGESAFSIGQDEQGLHGQTLEGKDLPSQPSVQKAWRELTDKGVVLIQPQLQNHPALAHALPDDTAITLRVVSRVSKQGIDIWWAELQVPSIISESNQVRGFWRMPVRVQDGKIQRLDNQVIVKRESQEEYDLLLGKLMQYGGVLPDWQDVMRHSIRAHQELPKVWAVAWDWVLTPAGPVLLEGNSGWGLYEMQLMGVDLVAYASNKHSRH